MDIHAAGIRILSFLRQLIRVIGCLGRFLDFQLTPSLPSICELVSPTCRRLMESVVALDTPSPYPVKDLRFRITILCLCISCFISALDTIILSSTLPAIATSLQATTTDAYWCSASFVFAQSVVQLIYAVVARALNRRTCMLAALGFFGFASILCATARNVQWLIAARTVSSLHSFFSLMLVVCKLWPDIF